ncbi:DNA-binding transcriptional LysR family regulator [Sphingomonas xinjiangensis]|uniref:DNA-binding transcriptional LysR family regulator n=1 Tax=Sphingomonas xinjiangensis TaxID=643568 RepID=A0A840YS23_9SPHN|nr:DNA-binding transcriptional LysR family regulator [Sphingomonas xinjiangensis]
MTKASGLLGISQPAMSGRLAKLRRLRGDPLFVPNSSGRGVVPTPRAEEIEPAIAGLIDSMLASTGAPTGFDPATTTRTFTIACFETPAAVLAPPLATAFRTRAPRARFSFVLPSVDVGEQLEAGDADLLLSGVEDVPGHLMHRTVWRDHYACARVRGAHPQLDLDVFCEVPHVVVANARDRFSTPIDDRLAALGRSRWVAASVQSYAVAAALAASGEYICTLPRRFLELPKPLPSYGNLEAYGNWGDLAADERWRKITPRHVLTHSTGFANFAYLEPDEKLRFHFDPGTRYAYSGEGIILLQFGLEQGLGLDMGAEIDRLIFRPLGMTRTSLKWRPDFAGNLADGWTVEGKVEPHDERSRIRVAGSMDTSITDLGRFAAALHATRALAEMTRPQLPITSRSQFPTLVPDAPPAERFPNLSAGLGVVTFVGPQGPGFYKGGHNESTGNTFVCVDRARRCVVILANDVRAERAFPAIVEAALGKTGVPFRWEYGRD